MNTICDQQATVLTVRIATKLTNKTVSYEGSVITCKRVSVVQMVHQISNRLRVQFSLFGMPNWLTSPPSDSFCFRFYFLELFYSTGTRRVEH